jgi:hypothetical protein
MAACWMACWGPARCKQWGDCAGRGREIKRPATSVEAAMAEMASCLCMEWGGGPACGNTGIAAVILRAAGQRGVVGGSVPAGVRRSGQQGAGREVVREPGGPPSG